MTGFSRPSPFDGQVNLGVGAMQQPLVTDADLVAEYRSVDTLARMGEALLELTRAAALSRGITLPARQSYYMAPIPADCEQVAALFTGWTPQPAPDGGTVVCRNFRWQAGFSVIITRCSPAVPKNPKAIVPVEKMMEAAKLASADADVLIEVLNRLAEVGSDVSVTVSPPSGGFQTTELNVPLLSTGSF